MFKTPAGEAEYTACYNRALAQWPVPYTVSRLSSRFGTTHIITCGPEDGPPLVLIHAAGTSSTIWLSNIAALSRTHRTILVDIIGDPNLSDCTNPFTSRADCVAWLTDLFDQLKIERADVAGISRGGWFALNLALGAPHRVKRLVLLAPAASFAPFRLAFFVRFMGAALFPSRANVHSVFKWLSGTNHVMNERLADQMYLAVKHFQFPKGGVWPGVFSDDELRSLRSPILLFIGTREVVVNPKRAFERATRLVPSIRAELLPNAGHLLNMEQADLVNRRMVEFLTGTG